METPFVAKLTCTAPHAFAPAAHKHPPTRQRPVQSHKTRQHSCTVGHHESSPTGTRYSCVYTDRPRVSTGNRRGQAFYSGRAGPAPERAALAQKQATKPKNTADTPRKAGRHTMPGLAMCSKRLSIGPLPVALYCV